MRNAEEQRARKEFKEEMNAKYGIIKNLKCTCSCCPSQWEGKTEKNEAVYIRYRCGHLTIQLSKLNGTIVDAINYGEVIYSEQNGGEYDGELNPKDLCKIIQKNNLFELKHSHLHGFIRI